MDPIKVGIIGCGYWGPNLIRNFVELPSSQVVAVADLKEDRLAYIKARFPSIETTQDYQDFFSMSLDAAIVATPPATHFRVGLDCLQHDLHLLVEKPLTLNSRDADLLAEEAERRGLTLMVGHTFEYNAAVRALRELIQSGELGQILYIDAVRVSLGLFQRDLNVLWDLAPHDISILRYILGHDPVEVSAQGADCVYRGKHDVVYLNLKYPNGILAHVRNSWLDPRKVRSITVVGSDKMVVYDDVENLEKIKIFDKGVVALPYTDTYGDFQCSYRYGDVVIPHIHFTEPLRVECGHFLDCIVHGEEPQSSGRVGLRVVEVLEAAERSLCNGGQAESIASEPGELGARTILSERKPQPVSAAGQI
jgi:predicted dehydrogenase